MNRTTYSKEAKRWVIKIGSALLTKDGKGLDYAAMANWTEQISNLRQHNIEVILVSSGSVAEGMSRMGWTSRPNNLAKLQAAAAIGQTGLIQAYETEFNKYQIQAAQVLLTHHEVSNRQRYLNARNTLRALLKLGALPIINENDTVALKELRLGDNDTLAALVANITESDLLLILTDQEGLFTKDPRHHDDAELISEESASNSDLLSYVGKTATALGSGGMATKLIAAQRAAKSGCATIIASGREDNVISRIMNGDDIGTFLKPDESQLSAKKQWIASQVQAPGTLILDNGACHALITNGSSLLPIGVVNSIGNYARGDVIDCKNQNDEVIARGLINYSSEEVSILFKQPSSKISDIVGYAGDAELIHRDNLVIL